MCIFCFNDTATTEIYTLSLHDALPILPRGDRGGGGGDRGARRARRPRGHPPHRARGDRLRAAQLRRRAAALPGDRRADRKSTRLNSSHANISYAVFCLKKKTYKGSQSE